MITCNMGKAPVNKKLSSIIVFTLIFSFLLQATLKMTFVHAADTTIHDMDYFQENNGEDGPVVKRTGIGSASFGFVMPVFNGGDSTPNDVTHDLLVSVLINDEWVDIDDTDTFIYNNNWGHWYDGGFTGFWFVLSETTYIQLSSKTNKDVTLEYTLEFENIEIDKQNIETMNFTDGPELKSQGSNASVGFTYPIFNNDDSIVYEEIKDDLKVYVKPIDSDEWIDIDNNPGSGWIYDGNFGQFWDGPGGYWFVLSETINVKLESISTGVNLVYTLIFEEPVRNSFAITPFDEGVTTLKADDMGAVGIPLPKIDGQAPFKTELDNFVYEVKVDGQWVALGDYSLSGLKFSDNGYNASSEDTQWGYWFDYIYGLWFQPIQEDLEFRVGYPINGDKGGNIEDNYVNYTFIGNPNAPRPDFSDMGDIELGTADNSDIEGWTLVWNDEFDGNSLDTSKWNYDTGYYLNDDPGTWGWGNHELQHYTDSEENVSVSDDNLNLTILEDPKSFPQDPERYAKYSSGKITTQDKFSFKYGRIDFCAKLPTGNGLWPALWLMPNDDVYGTWASSGEIDIMEARGRIPNQVGAALHFGGQWPSNTYVGGDYTFPEGEDISEYHVYSLVWEEGSLKWYVDGECYYRATNEDWYSLGAPDNENAPFDQEFYIIMNLAAGGWFDGLNEPGEEDIPATMQVDYVRVYELGDAESEVPDETEDPEDTEVSDETENPEDSEDQEESKDLNIVEDSDDTEGTDKNQTSEDKLIDDEIAKTGNNNFIPLALIAVSLSGTGLLVLLRKRTNKNSL